MNLKKAVLGLLALSLTGAFLAAFAGGPVKKGAILTTIPNKDAYQMIKANKNNTNFILLDVRTPEEFQEKHIKGAIDIDFHGENYTGELNKLDKSKKILMYCRSGNRSGKSLPVMKELGFREVYNMNGGLNEWELNNYPLVRP